MQIEHKLIRTGFTKLGNRGYWLPISDEQLAQLQIEPHDLEKIDFIVTIIEGRLRIEGFLRGTTSIHDTPSNLGDNQT